MQELLYHKRFHWMFFGGVLLTLVALWLPGLKYPILSDTAHYAFLGESLWQDMRFELLDVPYGKHLPFHAFVSYPFVWLLGYTLGMKVSTLLAGFTVLVVSFFLLERMMSREVAVLSVVFLTFHHAFVLMTQLGSADLLFTGLFLLSILAYLKADDDVRYYTIAFLVAGLACVTRYNGVPLFGLLLGHLVFFRRGDLRFVIVWVSAIAGGLIFALWLMRNWKVFGDPLYTEYSLELSQQSPGTVEQLFSNAMYYLNPLHNILPILLICAVWALWKHGKQQKFLIAAMLSAWVLTSFWWVQSMRFAFPAYPILMGFAVLGLMDIFRRFIRYPMLSHWIIVVGTLVGIHGGALCLYAYGECNALFDRSVGMIPKNLGLTSEGFYAWHVARMYILENVDPVNSVYSEGEITTRIWQTDKVMGPDFRLSSEECGTYRITQNPFENDQVLYVSPSYPQTFVVLQSCT